MTNHIERIIRAFLAGERRKRYGNYFLDGDVLSYRTTRDVEYLPGTESSKLRELLSLTESGRAKILNCETHELIAMMLTGEMTKTVQAVVIEENIIARRVREGIQVNSDILPLVGRRVSFGRERKNRWKAEIQNMLMARGAEAMSFSGAKPA